TDGLFCLSGCRKGLLASMVRAHRYEEAKVVARRLRDWYGPSRFFIELQQDFTPDAYRVSRELAQLADHLGVGAVATNNVHYARPEDYRAHDILRCIAAKATIQQVHPDLPLNDERYLKSPSEMAELFSWCPAALENTMRIAVQCAPVFPIEEEVTPRYPVP